MWSNKQDYRKFTVDSGKDYIYDDKLFNVLSSGIIVSFSGFRGTFELFKTKIDEYLKDYPETFGTTEIEQIRVDKIILKISEIIYDLYNKNHRRDDSFDVLVGVSPVKLHENRLEDVSLLKYFYSDGTLETIKGYKAIGTGAPYGLIFLKQKCWHSQMSMKQVAELGYFIIKYISSSKLATHV